MSSTDPATTVEAPVWSAIDRRFDDIVSRL